MPYRSIIHLPVALTLGSFAAAGALAAGTAAILAVTIERRSVEAVQTALTEDALGWAEVSANGLQVYLAGTAPSEAAAFRATSRVGTIIDADRIVNQVEVARRDGATPPRFSLDILRTGSGIQVIGLVPAASGVDPVTTAIAAIANGGAVSNLVETADFPMPETWDAALAYGLRALQELPRSKVTIYADLVEVQAISESDAQRTRFLAALQRGQPEGVSVTLDISAPRPVVTPFTLRFVRDAEGARFETCTADTEDARDRIVAAALAAGATGQPGCRVGLGVPSAQWGDAVVAAIAAVAELGAGTVAFSDADVTLIASPGADQDTFDRVIGELGAALPAVFSLQGLLPEASAEAVNAGPARFIATLGTDGQVRLRGRLPEGPVGRSVESYARALFGAARTDVATRAVGDLPEGWSVRAMVGLDALAQVNDGTLTLEPDRLILRGRTGSRDTQSNLTRLLTEELGQTAAFDLDLAYVEQLDPANALPSPQECVDRITAIQAETKITFAPGSVEISSEAGTVLDRIATVLPECRHVRLEISGHTDSQGRDEMNVNLSQSRADAVLNGLLARNVLVSNLVAQGYGSAQPVAPNDTETGREQNRRIEFRLLSEATDGSSLGAEDGAVRVAAPDASTARPTPRPATAAAAAEED